MFYYCNSHYTFIERKQWKLHRNYKWMTREHGYTASRTYLYLTLIVRERCRKIVGFLIKFISVCLLQSFSFLLGKSLLLGKGVARLEPSSLKAF